MTSTIRDDMLATRLAETLTRGALPGEVIGFGADEVAAAARFVTETAATRPAGSPAIAIEPLPGDGPRRLRLAAVNDDMPFLVDSVAAAIGERGLAIERILHPVLPVARDDDGRLTAIGEGSTRESMIYLEMDAVAEGERADLRDAVLAALADVRAAVADWPQLQAAMARDAYAMAEGEGRALLQWFLDGQFTLLGSQRWSEASGLIEPLGIARLPHAVPILAELVGPDVPPQPFTVDALWDGEGAPLSEVRKPQMAGSP